jgi:hypothetical protein
MLSHTQPAAKAGAPILYGARAQFNGRHDPTVAGFSKAGPRRFRTVSASHKASFLAMLEFLLGGTTRQYWEDQRCLDGIANFDSRTTSHTGVFEDIAYEIEIRMSHGTVITTFPICAFDSRNL